MISYWDSLVWFSGRRKGQFLITLNSYDHFFFSNRYHNDKMVNYDIQSGFFVTSIPFVSNNVTTTKLYQPASTSILSIKEVHLKNAGNYTCAPPNAKPSSIMVHVLRGMSVFFLFSIYYLLFHQSIVLFPSVLKWL